LSPWALDTFARPCPSTFPHGQPEHGGWVAG